MPFVMEAHDSLPYIDNQPSVQEREAAQKIIDRELPSIYRTALHPSVGARPDPAFSPFVRDLLLLKARDKSIKSVGGIDLSSYEAPSALAASASLQDHRTALRSAYISSSYLSGRLTNLELLEEFGKNAWLISNSQLEDLLKKIELELEDVKKETETINKQRKSAQEDSRGEIVALEETWRRGVGKILEVQVAAERLRQEIEKRRKEGR